MLKALKKYRAPYLFIMPFFILFLVFQLVPTIWTFYISLTNWKGIGTPDFCGFDNYRKMLIDDMFWESLGNTVVYWLTGLVFIICCALLIASLLNSRYLKSNSARAFFKTATFLPNICAAIAMGLIFRMLFDENVGLVNELVTMFGGSRLPWLTSTTFSKIPVIILNVWRYTPWFTMILLSGLLNISKDYYEAATVDGAKRIDIIRYIILPALVVPMTTMFILNLGFFMTAGFDQVFNFTNQSVNSVIDILDTYVYRIGLESGQYSLATAVALIKGIVGVFLVLVTHLVSKKVTGKGVW